MKFLSDERLYSDTERCLEFLRQLNGGWAAEAGARERFHLYWSGPPSTKLAFSVKSFLATQNLERSELW